MSPCGCACSGFTEINFSVLPEPIANRGKRQRERLRGRYTISSILLLSRHSFLGSTRSPLSEGLNNVGYGFQMEEIDETNVTNVIDAEKHLDVNCH